MSKYYYHGIESYYENYGQTLERINHILDEGLLTRDKVRGLKSEDMEHVCLYRKSDEWDYSETTTIFKSARSGWIDNCFVLIINPDIEVIQATPAQTDLVDEWRCYGDVAPEHFAGLGLPFDEIFRALGDDEYDLEDKAKINKYFDLVCRKAMAMGMFIVSSEVENFTDKTDERLIGKNLSLGEFDT